MIIDTTMLLFIAAGLLVGLLVGWFISRNKKQEIESLNAEVSELEAHIEAQKGLIDTHMQDITQLMVSKAQLDEQLRGSEKEVAAITARLSEKERALNDLGTVNSQHEANIAELEVTLKKDREAADEKLALLEDAKNKLGTEFKLLANQIFEERGKAFSEQNKNSLDEVLKPMKEQLGDFRKRVDEVHVKDAEGRASLAKHLEQLENLNRQMSEDAIGLTQALKGESKSQGNWGEMILERILETSGLREGKEFAREQSFTNEEGRRLRPDVVIYMPGDKQVIIDSKVSLTDYERVVSATGDKQRKTALTAHLRSLKTHIQGLSSKRYDHLPNVNSPDYVLMFVPIEGAYLMAIEEDPTVFESAFEQRVAVVTPSTLYATLKLIEQLWRYERQSENVVKLIDRAGKLHDKFVDFVKSFEEIGQRLDQAQGAYGTALDRIKDGRGSVISQIATLGNLAGKTKKELPKHLTESASISDQTDDS